MKKLVFNSDSILPALVQVAKIVAPKNALPILTNVMFKVTSNDTIILTASDGETWVSTKATIMEGDENLSFCVDAKDITSTLSSLSGRQVTFVFEDNSTTIKGEYNNGEFFLPFDNANEYPNANFSQEDSIEKIVNANVVLNALNATGFAIANDELRPQMCGVHFDFYKDKMVVAATDGHKLAKYSNMTITSDGEEVKGFTLPEKPTRMVISMLQKSDEDVKMTFNEKNVVFQRNDFKIVARLQEGRYPNYDSVIPKDNNVLASINREQLIDTIKRVMQFGSKVSELVSFAFEWGKVVISAEDLDFSKKANEAISCEYNGEPFTIGFNGGVVLSIISTIQSENVIIKMSDPSHAALAEPQAQQENEECLYLIMPMRIV